MTSQTVYIIILQVVFVHNPNNTANVTPAERNTFKIWYCYNSKVDLLGPCI